MHDATDSPAPPDPAPPKFRFKPRDFTADNAPVSTPSSSGPTDVREHLRAAAGGSPGSTSSLPAAQENEIHEILRANVACAGAAGLNEVQPVVRRPSRRRRDYWIVLVAANGSIAGLVFAVGPNVISVIFGFSGMVFISTALTWIMFFLLDDY